MALVRDNNRNVLRDAQGNARVCVTEAQAQAHDQYLARKKAQAAELAERIEARALRSPQEQLALLDARLGAGVGAVRERARLRKQIGS